MRALMLFVDIWIATGVAIGSCLLYAGLIALRKPINYYPLFSLTISNAAGVTLFVTTGHTAMWSSGDGNWTQLPVKRADLRVVTDQ